MHIYCHHRNDTEGNPAQHNKGVNIKASVHANNGTI